MTILDVWLQRWRESRARAFLAPGMRLLDVGCADGSLQRSVPELGAYVGIDPDARPEHDSRRRIIRGRFPDDVPPGEQYDAITMLAVLEHFAEPSLPAIGPACARLLTPGGRVILTVPSPLVDEILKVLVFARLVDGMAVEEHHHFDPRRTRAIFDVPDLSCEHAARFQLGLNHLFVFRRR